MFSNIYFFVTSVTYNFHVFFRQIILSNVFFPKTPNFFLIAPEQPTTNWEFLSPEIAGNTGGL